MTDRDESTPPDALLRQIAGDIAPVRQATVPWRRVALWIPLAVIVMVALPAVAGLRVDARILGPVASWGLSALQVTIAAALVWMAAREGLPSRRLPSAWTRLALGAALAGAVGLTFVTFAVSPTTLSSGLTRGIAPGQTTLFCYRGTLSAAAPLVLAAAWVLMRWLPTRPWLAGAMAGGGAGLAADAGWRLVCPVSAPSHVLAAHTTAVLTLAVAGAISARLLAYWRHR
jgi:hypothetical protein